MITLKNNWKQKTEFHKLLSIRSTSAKNDCEWDSNSCSHQPWRDVLWNEVTAILERRTVLDHTKPSQLCVDLSTLAYKKVNLLAAIRVIFDWFLKACIAEISVKSNANEGSTIFEVLGLNLEGKVLDLNPSRSSKFGLSSVEDNSFLLSF